MSRELDLTEEPDSIMRHGHASCMQTVSPMMFSCMFGQFSANLGSRLRESIFFFRSFDTDETFLVFFHSLEQ